MKKQIKKKLTSAVSCILAVSMLLSNVYAVIPEKTKIDYALSTEGTEIVTPFHSVLDEYYAEREARKAEILQEIEENESPEKWNVFLRLSDKTSLSECSDEEKVEIFKQIEVRPNDRETVAVAIDYYTSKGYSLEKSAHLGKAKVLGFLTFAETEEIYDLYGSENFYEVSRDYIELAKKLNGETRIPVKAPSNSIDTASINGITASSSFNENTDASIIAKSMLLEGYTADEISEYIAYLYVNSNNSSDGDTLVMSSVTATEIVDLSSAGSNVLSYEEYTSSKHPGTEDDYRIQVAEADLFSSSSDSVVEGYENIVQIQPVDFGAYDYVSMSNGDVNYTYPIASITGTEDFVFSLNLNYSSSDSCLSDFAYNSVFVNDAEGYEHTASIVSDDYKRYSIAAGWRFDLPYLEQNQLYIPGLGTGGIKSLGDYSYEVSDIPCDFEEVEVDAGDYDEVTGEYFKFLAYDNNGNTYIFDFDGNILRIEDKNNNYVCFDYSNNGKRINNILVSPGSLDDSASDSNRRIFTFTRSGDTTTITAPDGSRTLLETQGTNSITGAVSLTSIKKYFTYHDFEYDEEYEEYNLTSFTYDTQTAEYMDSSVFDGTYEESDDYILLTGVNDSFKGQSDYAYEKYKGYVYKDLKRDLFRVTERKIYNSHISTTYNYTYTGDYTGAFAGNIYNRRSYSYSVIAQASGDVTKKYEYLVQNVDVDESPNVKDGNKTYTLTETVYSEYDSEDTTKQIPYSVTTTYYGEQFNTPQTITTTYAELTGETPITQSFEYDENDNVTLEVSSKANGSDSDLYKTYYTYGNEYNIPVEIRYMPDENTTVVVQNTLSRGKILSSKTYVNDVLKEQIEYTYNSSTGNILTSKQWYDIANNKYIETEYKYDGHNNVLIDDIYPSEIIVKNVDNVDGVETSYSTTFVYDVMGRILSQTDANGSVTSYIYDELGNVITITLPNEYVVEYERSGLDDVVIYMPDGYKRTMVYSPEYGDYIIIVNKNSSGGELNERNIKKAFSNGLIHRQVIYTSDTSDYWDTTYFDQLLRATISQNLIEDPYWSYNHDEPESNSLNYTTYNYDVESINIGGITTTLFETSAILHNTNGTTASAPVKNYVNKYGETVLECSETSDDAYYGGTYTVYDKNGNIAKKYYKDGSREVTIAEYTYDYVGRVTSEKNADGNTRYIEYDALGRVTRESDYKGKYVEYTYDEMSNLIKQVTPLEDGLTNVKKMYYDGVGNLIKETVSAGTTESDTLESVTEYTYDNMGNVTDISYLTKEGVLQYTHYEYNVAGRVTKMYTGLSVPYSSDLSPDAYSLTSYTYNDFGYLISETDALGNVTEYEYDTYGNLLTKKLSNGTEYTYEYDIFGRVTEDNAWSTPDTVLDDGISFEYDTLGNVTSVKKSTWNSASSTALADRTKTPEVTYTYDTLGRLATESSSVGGKAIGKNYSYNQFGAETGFTLTVDGIAELEKISAYDDFLRLKSVTQDGKTTTYTYDDNGNLATETTGNVVTTYTYNDSNMVVSMGTTADGTVVTDFDYLYSRNGNQRQKTDNVTGTVTKYEYDLIGQLTSERKTSNGSAILADIYWYDASGNRTLKNEYRPDENGSLASKFIRSTYNKNNQLTATYTDGVENSYAYDTVGNMTADGGKGYTYTTRNQQKTFTNGDTSASYTYYYDGLRKSKTVGTNTTYFIWHNGNMVYEFTPNDSNSYTYGHRLISSDDAKYVLNAHGDVVALLNDSGVLTKRYDYDAFGNELNVDSTDTNPFRYCAEYFDTETGTIYLRARYYSPVTGRFTQIDPIRDGLNWYAYCYNNPILYIDPSGKAGSLTLAWSGSMWWLCLADTVLPVGDIIYGVGVVVCTVVDTAYTVGLDNLVIISSNIQPALDYSSDKIKNNVDKAQTNGNKSNQNSNQSTSNNSSQHDPKDPKNWNRNSTQTNSKSLYTSKDGRIRIDVENNNPAQRPGQVHLQEGHKKYIFDNVSKQFYDDATGELAPPRIQNLLHDSNIKNAINKALTQYLNVEGING